MAPRVSPRTASRRYPVWHYEQPLACRVSDWRSGVAHSMSARAAQGSIRCRIYVRKLNPPAPQTRSFTGLSGGVHIGRMGLRPPSVVWLFDLRLRHSSRCSRVLHVDLRGLRAALMARMRPATAVTESNVLRGVFAGRLPSRSHSLANTACPWPARSAPSG